MGEGKLNRRDLLQKSAWVAGAMAVGMPAAPQLHAQEAASADADTTWVSTTRNAAWQTKTVRPMGYLWNMLDVEVEVTKTAQTIEGFGGCFNELGWTSLQALDSKDQAVIFAELFKQGAGANFSLCRLPLGANDFSRNWYSYDEAADDFELAHFSIANDMETLIPFIKSAQQYNPKLLLWSSPWSPPTWMKRNGHYAEALQRPGLPPNGLTPEKVGKEGEDMFRQEDKYFQAYARYFGKYIDAYREQGVHVGMVMPQNEFNSAQAFPSCTWTAEGLAKFVRHLGPVMSERQVKIFFGTLERSNVHLLETVLRDPVAGKYIDGVGVQWAGKNALDAIHETYPKLAIYQSEQECGDSKNDWEYCDYCWDLMKTYLKNGASGYMYWNISLETGGLSRWGWPQNSLITVDAKTKSYTFNHEYYLLKHVSHFVQPGAKRVETRGTFDNLLAFKNPDASIAVIARNDSPYAKPLTITAGERSFAIAMEPQSFNTLLITPKTKS